jgi:hypothetical protein
LFFQNKGKPIVKIGPPPIKTDENTMNIILYILTSMGSISFENPSFSFDVHQITPSTPYFPLVSTLVESPSTVSMYSSLEVFYVSQTSHSHVIDKGFSIPYYTTKTLVDNIDSSTLFSHFDEEIL